MAGRRAAIVTGSSSGIGAAIARALAAAGHDVMMNGFGPPDRIEALRAEIAAAHGTDVRYHPADLSRPEEAVAIVRAAEEAWGRVDVLCNNAGVLNVPSQPVDEVDPARWDLTLAVNVTAAFHTIRTVLPGMKARGWGRIVNTASAAGLVGMSNSAPYVASKHAIMGLTRAVALELCEGPITCNAICPGLVQTEFMSERIGAAAAKRGAAFQDVARRAVRGRQPSGRLISVEEIAAAVVFLASDAASAINGIALPVDHAWTAM